MGRSNKKMEAWQEQNQACIHASRLLVLTGQTTVTGCVTEIHKYGAIMKTTGLFFLVVFQWWIQVWKLKIPNSKSGSTFEFVWISEAFRVNQNYTSDCIYSLFHHNPAFHLPESSWSRQPRGAWDNQKTWRDHKCSLTHTHPVDESKEAILPVWQLTRKMISGLCLWPQMVKEKINTVQNEVK